MKKETFIILEVISLLIFFSSWMIWNMLVKSQSFQDAYTMATGVTFIFILLLNSLIALSYQKLHDEY